MLLQMFDCDGLKIIISRVRLLNLALVFGVNLLNLIHVRMALKLFVRALSLDSSIFQNDHIVSKVDELNSMSDQNPRAVFHQTAKDLIEDLFTHVRVQGRDRVVHDENVRTLVNGTSKSDSRFLASG